VQTLKTMWIYANEVRASSPPTCTNDLTACRKALLIDSAFTRISTMSKNPIPMVTVGVVHRSTPLPLRFLYSFKANC